METSCISASTFRPSVKFAFFFLKELNNLLEHKVMLLLIPELVVEDFKTKE